MMYNKPIFAGQKKVHELLYIQTSNSKTVELYVLQKGDRY